MKVNVPHADSHFIHIKQVWLVSSLYIQIIFDMKISIIHNP